MYQQWRHSQCSRNPKKVKLRYSPCKIYHTNMATCHCFLGVLVSYLRGGSKKRVGRAQHTAEHRGVMIVCQGQSHLCLDQSTIPNLTRPYNYLPHHIYNYPMFALHLPIKSLYNQFTCTVHLPEKSNLHLPYPDQELRHNIHTTTRWMAQPQQFLYQERPLHNC